MATEKRLIWDEDAKRRIIALATGFHTDRLPVDMVINVILHQAPTVDAVEVVHGHMEEIEPCQITIDRQCCLCGTPMGKCDNYCPNCGAKMDGRNENGNL